MITKAEANKLKETAQVGSIPDFIFHQIEALARSGEPYVDIRYKDIKEANADPSIVAQGVMVSGYDTITISSIKWLFFSNDVLRIYF